MELILISDSKLKIMLSESDLESYSLTSEELDYGDIDTREAFKCILDEAKLKTGFDAECGQLFIKVFPSKNGGCEVYVTKESCGKEKMPQKKSQTVSGKKEYCVFKIDGIDSVCKACNVLMKTGYRNESLLYYEEKANGDGVYYLVLQQEGRISVQQKRRRAPEKCDVANEYGRKLNGSEVVFYIREHCREVCAERAVEKIGKLL